MSFEVPLPEVLAWVVISWTPTNSAAMVECRRCGVTHAIYTTALRRDPDAIGAAVREHQGCATP